MSSQGLGLTVNLPLKSGCVSRDLRCTYRHPGSCAHCGDDRTEAAVASGATEYNRSRQYRTAVAMTEMRLWKGPGLYAAQERE